MDKDFVSTTLETLNGIAIVGMDGRFPGADSIEQFWQNLRDGTESIKVFTDEELLAAGVPKATVDDPNYIQAGAVLSGIDHFDAPFFGISPREAKSMDPQHRILLECAWGALENAGYSSETYDGRIGVYTGTSLSTYLHHNLLPNPDFLNLAGDLQIELGNDKDFVPTRISYKMNLTGPSICINTACSTSLVAVHMACQGLLDQECDMALAGGATIQVPHIQGYEYQPDGIASPDGHCRPFDAQAQGTIFGSGVGVVVLKRLEDALSDRDHIYAVIRGSAINNDGSLKVGYTAPSMDGQADAIAEAQAIAGVEPETITYIEAHGTATGMGDPIEVAALNQVFRAETDQTGFCAIGSVKGNIGHLNRAAGVIGLIKTTLALKYRQLPASLNFEQPNPQIDFGRSPFYVNTRLQSWQTQGFPRRAGVSSFGIGGTNAHAILEEAPSPCASESPARPYQLLILSAKTETALETATQNLAKHLSQNPALELADVAFTLQMGRQVFNHRRILACPSCEQAITAIEGASSSPTVFTQSQRSSSSPSVVFMFSGQGSQYINMAHDLYQHEPIFREQVDHCVQILQPHLQRDLHQILYPNSDQPNAAETAIEELKQTALTQPALFVIEYALAQLWMTWGIQPQAMIGHSIGEYVAACLADVFSLEDALALVAARGQMMQCLPKGSMLAVFLPQDKIAGQLTPDVVLATSNSPKVSVVSGPAAAIDALADKLQAQEIDYRRIPTSHAFHSPMMEPILEDFATRVSQISLNPPQLPFVSNVTGNWITEAEATDPAYWARHVRQTVRFSEGIDLLLQDPDRILLEVGPGKSLQSLVKQNPVASERTVLSSVRHPKEDLSDVAFILQTLGQLWLAGLSIDWSELHAPQSRKRLPLPSYPFERQRYWVDPLLQESVQSPATASYLSEQITQFLAQSDPLSDEESQLLHKLLIRLDESGRSIASPANDDWFYQLKWELEPSSVPTSQSEIAPGRWLILADRGGVGQALATQLEQAGQDCILAFAGDIYQARDPHTWQLSPSNPKHFEQLLQDLLEPGSVPFQGVIYLWGIDSTTTADLTTDELDAIQMGCVGSVLNLVQALIKQGEIPVRETASQLDQNTWPKLWLVTQNAMPVIEAQSNLAVAQSTLWGLGKVLALEHAPLWGGLIDLGDDFPEQLPNLATEILNAEGADQLSYRGNQRYVAQLVRMPQPGPTTLQLNNKGTYLITGGLGSIGLQVATWLVDRGARHLVLLGRKPPSTSADVVIEQLEKLGAEIHTAQVDIAVFDELAQAFKTFDSSMPPIRGIFHTAGVSGNQAVKEMSLKTYDLVCRPKINGAWNLHQLTRTLALEFFVSFSSIASVWGAKGQAPYAMANQFLDSFTHFRQRLGYTALSVNWGPWLESGMASEPIQGRLSRMGVQALASAPAINALEMLLGSTQTPAPQSVVADIDWPLFKDLFEVSGYRRFLAQITDSASDQEASRSSGKTGLLELLRSQPVNESIQHLASFLQEHIAKTLNIAPDQLDPDQSLNYLGLDSLMAIELRNLIRGELKVKISTSKFISGLSVNHLAKHIHELLQVVPPTAVTTSDQPLLTPEEIVKQSSSLQQASSQQILANLNQLSDGDVDAVLKKLLAD